MRRPRRWAFLWGERLEKLADLRQDGDMDEFRLICRDTAFKHGQTEDDIRHAFETARYDCPVKNGENKWLLLGFNTKANPLEVMYNEFDGNGRNVFHAMPAQEKYLPLFADQE